MRNVLVEGLSGTGKTAVGDELARRGLHVVHGDRELAYQGDPVTGEHLATADHDHWIWDDARVRRLAADRGAPVTWFCGGLRNFAALADLFDRVLVLEVGAATLERRLLARPQDEFGSRPDERAFVLGLHAVGAGVPEGLRIDADRPLAEVVDEVVARSV